MGHALDGYSAEIESQMVRFLNRLANAIGGSMQPSLVRLRVGGFPLLLSAQLTRASHPTSSNET